MDTFRAVALLAGALLCAPTKLQADLVSIGYVSYDILIPEASGSPGVDALDIANFTGDPSAGGHRGPCDSGGNYSRRYRCRQQCSVVGTVTGEVEYDS